MRILRKELYLWLGVLHPGIFIEVVTVEVSLKNNEFTRKTTKGILT